MKIHTKAVHAGDRKKPGPHIPVTTPIHLSSSYFYESMEHLDRIFGQEEQGYCYARYDNPSAAALEELMCALESGAGALACASGMAAIHTAIHTALADRRRSIVAADALYGATFGLLMNVFEPSGVAVRFADVCDLDVLRAVRERFELPVGAYNVSGEYAMLKAAAQSGWLDERQAALESLTAIKRAGADFIVSYWTKELAEWL